MGAIKLPHASGNSMSIAAPASNPASDLTLTLPTTIGTNGQHMKVDGSGNLGWETPATVKLDDSNSTSTVDDIIVDSLDTTTYRSFIIHFAGQPVTDNQDLRFRWRTGGSDESTGGGYKWGIHGVTTNTGSYYDSAAEENYANVIQNAGNATGEGWRMHLQITPHAGSEPDYMGNFGSSVGFRTDSSGNGRTEVGSFYYTSEVSPNGFKLYAASGGIASHNYTIWGVKK